MKNRFGRIGLTTALCLSSLGLSAAELQPETVQAWDSYVQATEARMQVRLTAGHSFLWADEDSKRLDQLRHGEVLVAPIGGPGIKPAPNGLIHDWIGAVFIPNTSLSQIMDLVRDYDRYEDIYQPLVVGSKVIDKSGDQDKFSMRWVHRTLFVTAAVETEYCARTVRVSEHRYYAINHDTRIQDIQGYGTPGEHKLPVGQGSGFIWKLYSVTRYDERDGGVYMELEAVVLTRDIPASVRFMVKPLVTKLSRNSLLVSLTQTRNAVQSRNVKSNPPAQITLKNGNELLGEHSTTSFIQR